jgi:hypothetical protein
LPTSSIQTFGIKPPSSNDLLDVLLDVISTREISISHHKPRCHSELLRSWIPLMPEQSINLVAIGAVEGMRLLGLITHG